MNAEEFRKYAYEIVDWMYEYMENKENYRVKPNVLPNDIYSKLPENPPGDAESMDSILNDFYEVILPGMTHWQSPNFFAYFPANNSMPSILAEMITATLGAQCMVWETSPAAAELEEKMMNWLKQMTGLPQSFDGVIHDTASTATLCAILSAREKVTNFSVNEAGFNGSESLRVYCSTETHSSIEKAVKIAGLGKENLVKVAVDEKNRMLPELLDAAISNDKDNGYTPACVVVTLGTTGSTAIDPLHEILQITKKYNVWVHIDAALAGTALLLEEYRWMIKSIEHADSFVFNPHKWMFTNFDCSAYFVKDKETLIRTFEILPEYLKTKSRGKVNDYRDWGIALGRRFRALKLWFVIRSYGVEEIKKKIRLHIQLALWLGQEIEKESNFELMAEITMNTVCFRFHPNVINDNSELDRINSQLLQRLNNTGKLFVSHTRLQNKYTIRMVTSQTDVQKRHVVNAWELVKHTARQLIEEL